MSNTQKLIGKTVSLRTVAGYEIIGVLKEITENDFVIAKPLRMTTHVVPVTGEDGQQYHERRNNIEQIEPFAADDPVSLVLNVRRSNVMYPYALAEDIAENYTKHIETYQEQIEQQREVQKIQEID